MKTEQEFMTIIEKYIGKQLGKLWDSLTPVERVQTKEYLYYFIEDNF